MRTSVAKLGALPQQNHSGMNLPSRTLFPCLYKPRPGSRASTEGLREYAASRGWSIVWEYTDLGVSGSKESHSRATLLRDRQPIWTDCGYQFLLAPSESELLRQQSRAVCNSDVANS